MPMLFVTILMDRTLAHVNLDFQGMAEVAQVIFLSKTVKVISCPMAENNNLDGTMKHFVRTIGKLK